MSRIITSQEFGGKILEILGVEPNLVTNMTIELNPGEIAKCHITRCITGEEADELLTMFEEEQYCLMQLKIDKEEKNEQEKSWGLGNRKSED